MPVASSSLVRPLSSAAIAEPWMVQVACYKFVSLIPLEHEDGQQQQKLKQELFVFAQSMRQAGLCQNEAFILAFLYMERLSCRTNRGMELFAPPQHQRQFPLLNFQRALLISTMVASKFLDDNCVSNIYFAQFLKMESKTLNALEFALCEMLDYKLSVSMEEYEACLQKFAFERSSTLRNPVAHYTSPYILSPLSVVAPPPFVAAQSVSTFAPPVAAMTSAYYFPMYHPLAPVAPLITPLLFPTTFAPTTFAPTTTSFDTIWNTMPKITPFVSADPVWGPKGAFEPPIGPPANYYDPLGAASAWFRSTPA